MEDSEIKAVAPDGQIFMTPERWKEVERVFHEALKYQPSERSRFLNETCKEDEDLRFEVEALLAQESRAENFLEMPAMRVAAEAG